jgi:hypothetical protein
VNGVLGIATLVAVGGVALLPAFAGGPMGHPPSSLHPPPGRTTVLIRHHHVRVQRCSPVKSDPTRCAASYVDESARASVRLQLLEPPSTLEDGARSILVELAAVRAPQQRAVALARGEWRVERVNHAPARRLFVGESGTPRVNLQTTSGSCELERGRCVLNDRVRLRRIVVSQN